MLEQNIFSRLRVLPGGKSDIAGRVVAHRRLLYATALRLCRNEADALDLVQDTCERALRAGGALPADANLRGWLLTVVKNLFIDRARATRRRLSTELPEELAAPATDEPPAWSAVDVDDVRAALHGIDARFRRAYEMYELERRSYREISAALGIPIATVGTKLLRVRRKLQALLGAKAAA